MRRIALALLLVGCSPQAAGGLVLDGLVSYDDACLVRSSNPLLAEGVLDTSTLAETNRPEGLVYFAALHLSTYELRASRTLPRYEDEAVWLRHAEVEILEDGATAMLGGMPNPFVVPVEGRVPLTANVDGPGVGLGFATVLPETYVRALAGLDGRVELRIVVEAQTERGEPRTSTALTFPLRICDGCLVSCGAVASGNACTVGQDAASVVVCE